MNDRTETRFYIEEGHAEPCNAKPLTSAMQHPSEADTLAF